MDHKFFTNVTADFDFYNEKKKLIESLNYLKNLDCVEFTFYKKWEELKNPNIKEIASKAFITKNKIWLPTDINDEKLTIKEIEELNPEIVYIEENSIYYNEWIYLRLFCHTMEFSQSPGRFLRFLVLDRISKKYLGVLSVASDVIMITDRDNWIGWTNDNKLKDKKLSNSAIGSCIMSTQPFGYNFLGGKLMACLITSSVIRDIWKKLYESILVGMTTTSLYGSFSMYNNLKWWHKCGVSAGKILIKPDQSCYDVWHQWLKDNKLQEYTKAMTQKEGVSGPVTAAKLKIISMIMSACDVKQKNYVHGFQRGTYYSNFYENGKEFLQNKINEEKLRMKQLFKGDINAIMEWWKPKAINRYLTIKKDGRLKPEILFYDRMIDMTFEEAKKSYFSEVGR